MKANRPNIGKALLLSLLFLLVFFVIHFLILFLLSLLFSFLLNLPVLKHVTDFFLKLSENTPQGIASILSVIVAYNAVNWIMLRLNDEASTFRLIYRICGIIISVWGVFTIVLTIINGGVLITGVALIIAGIVFFVKTFGFKDHDLEK